MLDTSYVIIGTRAVRATFGFRIRSRTLEDCERENETKRKKSRKKESLSLASPYYDIFHRSWRYSGSLAARDAVVNDINVINTVILLPSLLLLLLLSLL